ncbi:CHASE2 domain-containing serine/threonine-protein kinase [Anthocerotibacter panamensis]|uniref:CHASE2 domain-containing serine/threonine-protein kinase n=1 Tax=Anthocerotibacter panamensis TaxID=2857077 RepID=UPI001C404399|nr:CHASE2 domain-containing serine/threonine-protein kinase [Anthocerotibacter panamensis]
MTPTPSSSLRQFRGLPVMIGAGILATLLVLAVRYGGGLQGMELWVYDKFVQLRPDEGPDKRIGIVTITDEDLNALKEPLLPDRVLEQVLAKLEAAGARTIGLDIYRDVPVGQGRATLLKRLQASDRILAICKLPSSTAPQGLASPPGVEEGRVGFSDIPKDADDTVRRVLLTAPLQKQSLCQTKFAMSFLLALNYLFADGSTQLQLTPKDQFLQIGTQVLRPLESNAGGYRNLESGNQIFLNFRSPEHAVDLATLTEVLYGGAAERFKDRIVLIGYLTESLGEDTFYTPYGRRMPGVMLQAQATSQILSAVQNQRPLLWYWSDAVESLWVGLWGLMGILLAWSVRPPLLLRLGVAGALLVLAGVCLLLFTQQSGWIPFIPAALALGLSTTASALLRPVQSAPSLQTTLPNPPMTSAQEALGRANTVIAPGFGDDMTAVAGTPVSAGSSPSDADIVRANGDFQGNRVWIGRTIGQRYRLQKLLGRGGMGEVYLATDIGMKDRQVAVKLLRANLASAYPPLWKRFEREIVICGALNNPNIVQVSDHGQIEGYPFYIMEYLNGQSLRTLLNQEGRLELRRALRIIAQICNGLRFAHQGIVLNVEGQTETVKVVHRDLKPDNIFLLPMGAMGELVKILDFGIAKAVNDETKEDLTQASFIGTTRYAAPEQLQGRQDLDQRADIYSLGVIFYEMLSGSNPFALDSSDTTDYEWAYRHIGTEPVPLHSQPGCEDLPLPLEAVVMRCLRKSPAERFASVDELEASIKEKIPGLL